VVFLISKWNENPKVRAFKVTGSPVAERGIRIKIMKIKMEVKNANCSPDLF